jgi:hypothetical protein
VSIPRRRLEILADALSVRPSEVVSTLRRKNLHQYVDALGATLFDVASSDAELVEAAFRVFVGDLPPPPNGKADHDLTLIPRCRSVAPPADRSRHAAHASPAQLALPLCEN